MPGLRRRSALFTILKPLQKKSSSMIFVTIYPFKEQINQISGVGGEVQPLSAFPNPGTPQSPLVCLIPCSGHLGINPALLCPALPTPQTSLGEIMILKSFCKQQKPV